MVPQSGLSVASSAFTCTTQEPVREQPWDVTRNAGDLFVNTPPQLTSNATWVPENQYGRTLPDPVSEVGRHIVDKPGM